MKNLVQYPSIKTSDGLYIIIIKFTFQKFQYHFPLILSDIINYSILFTTAMNCILITY